MSTEIERLIVRLVGETSQYQASMAKALTETQRTTSGIEREMSTIKASIGGLEQAAQKVGAGLQSLGGSILGFGAMWSAGITAPITGFLGASLAAATKMESLKLGLTAVAGSTEEAEKQLAALREVAKLPGLGLEEAIQGSINLQAVKLNADLSNRALAAFGNALATVGKGRHELQGVILALTQIVAKGKVSAEEIMQIAERMPQVREAMKQAFGTSDTEKLQKMGIKPEQFIEGLIKEFEKLPKVAGGAANTIENFKDTTFFAMVTIGNVVLKLFLPALNKGAEIVQKFAEWFQKLNPTIQTAIVVVAALAAAVGPLLVVLGGAVMAAGAFVAAIGTIGLPVIAGIVAVGTAIAGITVAIGAATYAIMGPDGIKSAFESMVKFAQDAFKKIDGFLANWKHNTQEISSWFKDNWLEIFLNVAAAGVTAFKNMADNMIIALVNSLALGVELFQTWAMTVGWTMTALGTNIKEIIGGSIAAAIMGKEFDISPGIKKLQTSLENGVKAGMKTTEAVVKNFKAPMAFKGLLDGFETSLDEWPDLIMERLGAADITAGLKKAGEKVTDSVGDETKKLAPMVKGAVKAVNKELDFMFKGTDAGSWEDIKEIEEQIRMIRNMGKEVAAGADISAGLLGGAGIGAGGASAGFKLPPGPRMGGGSLVPPSIPMLPVFPDTSAAEKLIGDAMRKDFEKIARDSQRIKEEAFAAFGSKNGEAPKLPTVVSPQAAMDELDKAMAGITEKFGLQQDAAGQVSLGLDPTQAFAQVDENISKIKDWADKDEGVEEQKKTNEILDDIERKLGAKPITVKQASFR